MLTIPICAPAKPIWSDKSVNELISDNLLGFWEKPNNPGLLLQNQDGSIACTMIPIFVSDGGRNGVVAVTKYGCGLVETIRYRVDYILDGEGRYLRTKVEAIDRPLSRHCGLLPG